LVAQEGLTPERLRSIGIEYRVNRMVRHTGQGGDRAGDLCRMLQEACARWPDDLCGRAQVCAEIADQAFRMEVSSGRLASASTKFMWFLRPDRWTVCDRLARRGLGLPPQDDTIAGMQRFYDTLGRRHFLDLTADMNATIVASPLRGLPAERILDSLLLARGRLAEGAPPAEIVTVDRGFLRLLPEPTRTSLQRLATALQRQVGNAGLLSTDQQEGCA
jgi:hypothetical protein